MPGSLIFREQMKLGLFKTAMEPWSDWTLAMILSNPSFLAQKSEELEIWFLWTNNLEYLLLYLDYHC